MPYPFNERRHRGEYDHIDHLAHSVESGSA